MPVYNGERYLREAVDSILNQTFTDFEFIIVDDGSTDETSQILDSCSDPRIVRIRNEENLGLTASLNSGIERAQGEYIARMDADDISLSTRLEAQLGYLERHLSVGVLSTRGWNFNTSNSRIPVLKPQNHNELIWELVFGNPFIHAAIMMRKQLVVDAGGYHLSGPAQDRELWIRLYRKTQFANLPEFLYLIRLHPDSVTSIRRKARRGGVYSPYPEPDLMLRKRLVEDILGREVPIALIDWLTSSQRVQNILNRGLEEYQIELVVALLLEIYESLVKQSVFVGDTAEVKHDLLNRIVTASRYSPQCVMPGKLAKTWRRPLQRRALLAVRELAKIARIWPSHWN